jgi:hypothetical protein
VVIIGTVVVGGEEHTGRFEVVSDPRPRQGKTWCSCGWESGWGPWKHNGPWSRHILHITNGWEPYVDWPGREPDSGAE